MKIDNRFFEERWVKAIRAEFGAQGVLAVIRLLGGIYDSPQGYWREWSPMDRAVLAGEAAMTVEAVDALMSRLADYRIISEQKLRKDHVITSQYIQCEYIRQAGVARARRLTWRQHCLLDTARLLELGVYPAVPDCTLDEDYGTPLPVCPKSPGMYSEYRLFRLRHPDPRTHIYRVAKTIRSRRQPPPYAGNHDQSTET